jgi:polyisoprenoid-binding protein YceI
MAFLNFRHAFACCVAATVAFSATAEEARSVRFDMRDGGLRNLVQFTSDAPLEKVVGVSNTLSGWVSLDPDKLQDGIRGEFEVDVRAFETGLPSRNEQLRDIILNASAHPVATFKIDRVVATSKPRLVEGAPTLVRLEGSLRMRGITRPQLVIAKLSYFRESPTTRQRLPGNLIKVSATLDVDTEQFQISMPSGFQALMARYVQVAVDMVGSDRILGRVSDRKSASSP